jgi:hypothetical protein
VAVPARITTRPNRLRRSLQVRRQLAQHWAPEGRAASRCRAPWPGAYVSGASWAPDQRRCTRDGRVVVSSRRATGTHQAQRSCGGPSQLEAWTEALRCLARTRQGTRFSVATSTPTRVPYCKGLGVAEDLGGPGAAVRAGLRGRTPELRLRWGPSSTREGRTSRQSPASPTSGGLWRGRQARRFRSEPKPDPRFGVICGSPRRWWCQASSSTMLCWICDHGLQVEAEAYPATWGPLGT